MAISKSNVLFILCVGSVMHWLRPSSSKESVKRLSMPFPIHESSNNGHLTLLRLKSPTMNIFLGFLTLEKVFIELIMLA